MRRFRWITITLLLLLGAVPLPAVAAENAAAKALVIDVRTEAEWADGHLEGAIRIPYEKIGDEIGKVAPDKKMKIILYCRSGRRSGIGLETLKKNGYEDVSNYGSVKDAAGKLNVPIIRGDK